MSENINSIIKRQKRIRKKYCVSLYNCIVLEDSIEIVFPKFVTYKITELNNLIKSGIIK